MKALQLFGPEKNFELVPNEQDPKKGSLNGEAYEMDLIESKPGVYHLLYKGKSYEVEILERLVDEKKITLRVNGNSYTLQVKDQFDALLEKMGLENLGQTKVKDMKAPMPGLVLSVEVASGAEVKKGDALLVLEAMKMENVLKSPTDGIVSSLAVKEGDAVEKNQLLLTFE